MASLADIKTEFYAIVGEPSTSTVYPSSDTGGSYVENLANRVQDDICRSKKWWFLKTKYLFSTAVDTTFDGAVATTDTEIDLTSATGFPTSGAIWANQDVINYTGVSTNQLTGVTNIDLAHSDDQKVEVLYTAPSDFSHDPNLILQGTGTPIRYERVEDLDDNTYSYDELPTYTYRWSFIYDKDGNDFIRLKNPQASKTAVLHYQKAAPTMTDSQGSTIPDPFALKVIPMMMASQAMMERGDNPDNLANDIGAMAEKELNKFKNYNTRKLFGIRPKIINKYHSQRGS
jgi:hypothetical protein